MRFLIDARLPRVLNGWLRARGHEAWHVSDVLGGRTPDVRIAAYAETNQLLLISKGDDFLLRHPPERYRLVWLRGGNVTNRGLFAWLEARWPAVEARLAVGERLVEVR